MDQLHLLVTIKTDCILPLRSILKISVNNKVRPDGRPYTVETTETYYYLTELEYISLVTRLKEVGIVV